MEYSESTETAATGTLYSGSLTTILNSTWTSVSQDDSEKIGESSKVTTSQLFTFIPE